MSDREEEPRVLRVTMAMCEPCRSGVGGECHTPGCGLYLSSAPDIPIRVQTERPEDEPPEQKIIGTWLAEKVDGCTCGPGPMGEHEPGCGWEPLVDLTTVPGWPPQRSEETVERVKQAIHDQVWVVGNEGSMRSWDASSEEYRDRVDRAARDALRAAGDGPR